MTIKKKKPLGKKGAKDRILRAAREEFAHKGFAGARVESISQKADINKAMIFYYFHSKENLYKEIIQQALSDLMPRVNDAFAVIRKPEHFFEIIPRLYMEFFKRNPDLIKIIGQDLLHNPAGISTLIRDLMYAAPISPQTVIQGIIRRWYAQGKITESDPVHFVMNVIPLCLFSFLGKPMVEAILDKEVADDDEFLEARIQSITNLLKRGMLR